MNEAIQKVETALAENSENMRAMSAQMQKVRKEIADENAVFAILQGQIEQIAAVADQITSIAASTKMLALNASIEAARAGASGAGFAVVASKVQDLAVDSNRCSDQVAVIVEQMQEQIARTAEELQDSVVAIEESVDTLTGLENANEGLTTQFIGLYENIEQQNYNIQGIDSIFGNLRDRVLEMGAYAEENQAMVDSIATATKSYRHYVNDIVKDTKHIHNLSAAMLETSASVRE
jgi:methyl-accepting chemotaxis protein